MPADFDPNSWLAALAAALGIGSGSGVLGIWTTQAKHAEKLDQLRQDVDKSRSQIEDTHTSVTRLEERTGTIQETVSEIKGLLLDWRKNGR